MPVLVKLKWYGKKQKKKVRDIIHEVQETAGKQMVAEIKKSINTAFPPASRPGRPPHRRTGNLQKSIDYWVDKKTFHVQIGPNTDALYGIWLEEGTVKMDPRPYLEPVAKRWRKKYSILMRDTLRRRLR